MKRVLPLILISLFLFSGCATYRMNVNSLAKDWQPVKPTYYLIPEKGQPLGQMELEELEGFIETSLLNYAYSRVDVPEKADVFIVYKVSVGEISYEPYSFSLPVYGQTGGGQASYNAITTSKYGNAYSFGQVNQAPQYGVVGSQSFSGVNASLPFYFRLQGWNIIPLINKTGVPEQIWDVSVSHSSSDGDLRRALPYLVTAASRYIGKDSKKKVRAEVTSLDGDFHAIYKNR